MSNNKMVLAKDLKSLDIENWRRLAAAFYNLAHNDFDLWNELPDKLKQTDVGVICEQYIQSRGSNLVEKAGCLLAGEYWYVALGR